MNPSSHASKSPRLSPYGLYGLIGAWVLVTFLVSGALLLVQAAAQINPDYIRVVQFAPTIALLTMMLIARRRMKAVQPGCVAGGVTGRVTARSFWLRWLLAMVVIIAYAGMILGTVALFGSARTDSPFASGWLLLLFCVLQLAGSCGEEFGWRGFLQPALETRMPRLLACVVTGVLWALWHVQIFANPWAGVLFTVTCVALSILFGYLVIGNTWQRGFIAGSMHAVVNVTMFLAIDPKEVWMESIPLPALFLGICALALLAARSLRGKRQVGERARIMISTSTNEKIES